jgi:hypothetical protein
MYKYALNFHNSPSGNIGIITTTAGNDLVSFSYPAGGNKVVGQKEFVRESKNYYFVWNSNGDHRILEYDYEKNIISVVFADSVLDFDQDVIITAIDIVTFKSNTIIYWTDNKGEPKKVSIKPGIRTYDPAQGLYVGEWNNPNPDALYGIQFDGVSTYMNLGQVPLINLEGDFIELKFLATNWQNIKIPFGYVDGINGSFQVFMDGSYANEKWAIQQVTSTTYKNFIINDEELNTLRFEWWTSTEIRMFVNGIYVGENLTGVAMNALSAQDFFIGARNNNGASNFAECIWVELNFNGTIYNHANNWGGGTNFGGVEVISLDNGQTWATTAAVAASVISTADAGEVVKLNFWSAFYNRVFYYISKVDGNTDFPALALNDPTPSDNWLLAPAGYVYPDPVTLESITQIPEPPVNAPAVLYQDNNELGSNRLKSQMWQFKYKYVFADGQESAWSPISKVPLPNSAINPLDSTYISNLKDNEIQVGLVVSENTLIKSVKIASRQVPNSRAPLDFKIHDEIFTDDFTVKWGAVGLKSGIIDIFNNQEERLPIDLTESNQLFYWVPRFSQAQTITGDNRMLHSNGVWGYDVDPNLLNINKPNIDVQYNNALLPSPSEISQLVAPTTPQQSDQTLTFFDIDDILDDLSAGDFFSIEFSGTTDEMVPNGFDNVLTNTISFSFDVTYTVSKTDADSLTAAALKTKVANDLAVLIKAQYYKRFRYLVNEEFTWIVEKSYPVNDDLIKASVSGNVVSLEIKYYFVDGIDYDYNNLTYWLQTKIDKASVAYEPNGSSKTSKSYKHGSTQTFGLVYSDQFGRVSTVITSDDLVKKVNWHTRAFNPTNNEGGIVTMDMIINHQAPSWATKCHIVKKQDNGITRFVQIPFSIENASTNTDLNHDHYFTNGFVNQDGNGSIDNDPSIETVCIYINALNGGGEQAYNNVVENSVIDYSFAKGDRVRFISNLIQTNWYDEDVEILGYNDLHNYIIINKNHLAPDGDPGPLMRTALDPTNEYDSPQGTPTTPSSTAGLLMEIYTPQNEEDLTGFYYETGITLDVVNGNHVGTDGVSQDFQQGVPAKVALDCGDVYYKPRWYNTGGITLDGQTYYLEEYNYNDTYASKAFNVGRFNLKSQVDSGESTDDRSGQSQASLKPTTIFYSHPYAQGTDVNRLGTIYDTNFKTADDSWNSIQRLHSEGDKIYIFHEDRVGWAFNSRYVKTDLQGNNAVVSGVTTPAVSDIQYYQYKGGISLNPESFATNEGRMYFFDMRRGNVLRLSQNGIDSISLGSIDGYVKDVADKMLSGPEKNIAIASYDKRFHEYVLNLKWSEAISTEMLFVPVGPIEADFYFDAPDDVYVSQFVVGTKHVVESETPKPSGLQNPDDIYSLPFTIHSVVGQRVYCLFDNTYTTPNFINNYSVPMYRSSVIAYSDLIGAWSSFFSYVPDFLGSAGMNLISWKDGQLYIHDQDTANPNNFYGVAYPAELEIVANEDPVNTKDWMSVGVVSNDKYDATDTYEWDTVEDGITTSEDQTSDLITSDFGYREGTIYAGFLMDKNTPNVVNGLFDGERLKGKWIKVRLRVVSGSSEVKEVVAVIVRSALSFFAR